MFSLKLRRSSHRALVSECALEQQPPGWVTTTFGTQGLASLVLGLASARLAATAMVSPGMKSVFDFHL